MRKHLLLGLIAGLALFLVSLKTVPLYADNGPGFQIVQPQPDLPIRQDQKIPIEIRYQSTQEALAVRYDVYLDSTWLLGGAIRHTDGPVPVGRFTVQANFADLKVQPGRHTLYIKLGDSRGHVTQHDVNIVLQPSALHVEYNPPRVRITEPKDGDEITGAARICAEATDESGVQMVWFYVNGNFLAMTNQAPYVIPWDPIKKKMANGQYTLRARALDFFENEGVSNLVTVSVRNPFLGETHMDSQDTTAVGTAPVYYLVTDALAPSGGPAPMPWAFSNMVPPFGNPVIAQDSYLPALAFAPRNFTAPTASSELVALLPPKALPGQSEMAIIAVQTRGMAVPPALAMLPGAPLPPTMSTGTLTPVRGEMLVPVEGPVAGRAAADARPAGAVTPMPAKATPAMTTARREEPLSPVGSVDVALVPGTDAHAAATDTHAPDKVSPVHPAATADQGTPVRVAGITQDPAGPALGSTPERMAGPSGLPFAGERDQAAPAADQTPAAKNVVVAVPVLIATADVPVKSAPQPATRAREATEPLTPAGPQVARATGAPGATVTPNAAGASAATVTVEGAYTVKRGDTLLRIARAYDTTPDQLLKMNPGLTPERPLSIGARLVVPQSEARIYVDNTPITGYPDPYVARGYSMVPVRALVEAKGGTVVWLPKTQQVNAWANNTFIGVKLNSRDAKLDAQTLLLPIAPALRQSRTMVPLRFLMTALRLEMQYNAETGTYYLVSQNTP